MKACFIQQIKANFRTDIYFNVTNTCDKNELHRLNDIDVDSFNAN